MSEATDHQDWLDLRAGRPAALERIIDAHWHSLVSYVHRIVGDRDVAEDVVQDILGRLWQRRTRWKTQGSVQALLFRMARNAAIDVMRHGRRDEAMRRAIATGPSSSPAQDSAGTEELDRLLRAAVSRLPIARREVFLLVRMTSLSHAEIADLLGIAPQTVANHMRLALADLRNVVAEYQDGPTGERLTLEG